MGTITAGNIVRRANIQLQGTRIEWTDVELMLYLSDAQREAVMLRPDINPKVANMALDPGSRQAIPSDAFSILNVVRNMGTQGTTPGKAIKAAKWDDLDRSLPNWHETTALVVNQYVYDAEKSRDIFYVYPAQPTGATQVVELIYSAIPPEMEALSDVITLSDTYQPLLLVYVLHRALTKTVSSLALQRARIELSNMYYEKFRTMLLGQKESELKLDPLRQAAIRHPAQAGG